MANYGMAFDYKLCINCHACEVACNEENGIDLGAKNHRLWIQEDALRFMFIIIYGNMI